FLSFFSPRPLLPELLMFFSCLGTRHPSLATVVFALCYLLCFQSIPNCPSCNPFVLITIRIAGGGWVYPISNPANRKMTNHDHTVPRRRSPDRGNPQLGHSQDRRRGRARQLPLPASL